MNKETKFNLEKLFQIIERKIIEENSSSYSYQLFKSDCAKISQKIGEEGVEVAIAALLNEKNNNKESRQDLINEVCDLFYHVLVLLKKYNISLSEIFDELERRNKN